MGWRILFPSGGKLKTQTWQSSFQNSATARMGRRGGAERSARSRLARLLCVGRPGHRTIRFAHRQFPHPRTRLEHSLVRNHRRPCTRQFRNRAFLRRWKRQRDSNDGAPAPRSVWMRDVPSSLTASTDWTAHPAGNGRRWLRASQRPGQL